MNWAAYTLIGLYLISFGMYFALHGKPKENPNYNAWNNLISLIIVLVLLYFGGFFK